LEQKFRTGFPGVTFAADTQVLAGLYIPTRLFFGCSSDINPNHTNDLRKLNGAREVRDNSDNNSATAFVIYLCVAIKYDFVFVIFFYLKSFLLVRMVWYIVYGLLAW